MCHDENESTILNDTGTAKSKGVIFETDILAIIDGETRHSRPTKTCWTRRRWLIGTDYHLPRTLSLIEPVREAYHARVSRRAPLKHMNVEDDSMITFSIRSNSYLAIPVEDVPGGLEICGENPASRRRIQAQRESFEPQHSNCSLTSLLPIGSNCNSIQLEILDSALTRVVRRKALSR